VNLVTLRPVVYAYANRGRWVVDCPVCSDALKLTPGEPLFGCWGCGTEAEVVWPVNPAAIERLLGMRPLAQSRNWQPGETLHDLLAENVAHGIGPDVGESMTIIGDKITADTLPAARGRLPIGA
jgi:hypothetical protein